jgi:membrane-bound lytic murein transglycosylase D
VALSDAGKEGADGKELNKYYTVKKGDTLYSLATKFNISAKFLALWNNLKGKLALQPGKRIIVAKFVEKQGTMAPVGDQNG